MPGLLSLRILTPALYCTSLMSLPQPRLAPLHTPLFFGLGNSLLLVFNLQHPIQGSWPPSFKETSHSFHLAIIQHFLVFSHKHYVHFTRIASLRYSSAEQGQWLLFHCCDQTLPPRQLRVYRAYGSIGGRVFDGGAKAWWHLS